MSDAQALVGVIAILASVCVGVGITQWLYGHVVAREMKRIATAAESIATAVDPLTKHVMKLRYAEVIREIEAKLDRIEQHHDRVTDSVTPEEATPKHAAPTPAEAERIGAWAAAGDALDVEDATVGSTPDSPPEAAPEPTRSYVLNRVTGALHMPGCGFEPDANRSVALQLTRQQLIDKVDDPLMRMCSRCKPLTKGVA